MVRLHKAVSRGSPPLIPKIIYENEAVALRHLSHCKKCAWSELFKALLTNTQQNTFLNSYHVEMINNVHYYYYNPKSIVSSTSSNATQCHD